jgi:hypothetical protein
MHLSIPLKQMSVEEKLQAIEEIWTDLDLPPLTRPLTLGKSRLLFFEILPGSGRLNHCAV